MFMPSAGASNRRIGQLVELDLKLGARAHDGVGVAEAAAGVTRHDAVAVNSAASRQLYKKREPIYPKLVHGRFRAFKWLMLVGTLAVYYLTPWLRWPRGPGEPSQAVLIDFAGGRFYFFFIEIWPNELYFVTGLLILAALALFLATALFGRVWCGYACPQTVWTDLFIAAERLIEGDRNARIKLARSPWTGEKIARKAIKHAAWIAIAAATGGAWILYFHDAPTIVRDYFNGAAPASAYFFSAALTFTTYMLAGSMREQVCTYMCPWPRIQAALTDEETLQVTYRADRGEPRGPHKKGESWEGRGDCVDCTACAAACPMGIDIREGAQLECINCALCIDACDEVMAKVGRPQGLIAYDTDRNLLRRRAGERPRFRFLRPRTGLYAVALLIVAGVMLVALAGRSTFEASVQRDRSPPFIRLSDGSTRNAYTVKIVNKANVERTFLLTVDSDARFSLSAVGLQATDGALRIAVAGDDVHAVRIFLTQPAGAAAPQLLAFVVREAEGGAEKTVPSAFMTERGR
jgi:cytochrome c oxidase accessory protein FixG